MRYLLLVQADCDVLDETAAERGLAALRALNPAPARIEVIDHGWGLAPGMLSAAVGKHGLRVPSFGPRAALHELADSVLAEAMSSKAAGQGLRPYHKVKCYALARAAEAGLDAALYVHFPDHWTANLPRALLAALADPGASFAYPQVFRCDPHGEPLRPRQALHRRGAVRSLRDGAAGPGVLMRVGPKPLDLSSERLSLPDSHLALLHLLDYGVGQGVSACGGRPVEYYHVAPNPELSAVVAKTRTPGPGAPAIDGPWNFPRSDLLARLPLIHRLVHESEFIRTD